MFHTSKIPNLFYYLTREKQEINFSVFVKTYNISSLNSAKYTKRVFFALLLENFTRFQRYFTYSRLVTCLTYSRSAFSLNYLEQYLRKKYCFRKMQGLFEKSHCWKLRKLSMPGKKTLLKQNDKKEDFTGRKVFRNVVWLFQTTSTISANFLLLRL